MNKKKEIISLSKKKYFNLKISFLKKKSDDNINNIILIFIAIFPAIKLAGIRDIKKFR